MRPGWVRGRGGEPRGGSEAVVGEPGVAAQGVVGEASQGWLPRGVGEASQGVSERCPERVVGGPEEDFLASKWPKLAKNGHPSKTHSSIRGSWSTAAWHPCLEMSAKQPFYDLADLRY